MSCTTVAAEEALTSRLLQSTVQALELFGVYLGKELGLYAAFESDRSLTPVELAARTGIAVRYEAFSEEFASILERQSGAE